MVNKTGCCVAVALGECYAKFSDFEEKLMTLSLWQASSSIFLKVPLSLHNCNH